MNRISRIFAAFALVAITASTAEAQMPITVGVQGGVAIPTGDLGDGADAGFTIGAGLGFSPAMIPFGLRFDVDFTRFGVKESVVGVSDVNFQVISGTLNGLFNLPAAGMSPYLIAGVGMFSSKFSGGGGSSDSETDFGAQGGVGISFGLAGLSAGLEAKYVNIFSDGDNLSWIPITVRINFGGN
jgi:hypothetical protein